MPRSISMSFRISADKARKVDQLAKATERPKSWLLEQALDAYLETQAWQVDHIEKGLQQLRRGEVAPHEEVAQWLSSWGTDDEGKPPR